MIIDTIVTDLDDTLLNERSEISDFSLDVMRECLKRGIRVIPASGRARVSMEPFMRRLNTGLPYIACNGAQLVNADHTPMETLFLPAPVAREICAYLQSENCFSQVYRDDFIYYAEETDVSRNYQRATGMEGFAVGDLQAFLTFDTPKILCISEPEKIAGIYPKMTAEFEGRAIFAISKPWFLEAEPPGATKGEALAKLANHMEIDPAKTLAFGDSMNDLSMLAYARYSVAMGNARDEVRRAARYLCGSNHEDGMARFVLRHVLDGLTEEGQQVDSD